MILSKKNSKILTICAIFGLLSIVIIHHRYNGPRTIILNNQVQTDKISFGTAEANNYKNGNTSNMQASSVLEENKINSENSSTGIQGSASVNISGTPTSNVNKEVRIMPEKISATTQTSSNVTISIETKSPVTKDESNSLHVQRKYKMPINCTAIVDEKNITEIAKADMITQLYREYRFRSDEGLISKDYMDDLRVIPDKNYIFDQSKCEEFIAIRGYNNYTVTDEEKDFPFAFSMLTYENAEQFERLLRVIYRPQNAYCIHVDNKSSETFQKAVKSIVQCFPNVFIATKREEVYWGHISRLQADLNCIHDFLMAAPDAKLPSDEKSAENVAKFWSHENMKNKMFRNDWKYLLTLASTEFPIRTNRELVQILKIYNGTNDIDYMEKERFKFRYEYHYELNKASGKPFITNVRKGPPPYNYTVVKGITYSTLSHAFIEYVMNSVEAKALLDWVKDTELVDEWYWGTIHYSTNHIAPGHVERTGMFSVYLTRFMGWPGVYECAKGGRRVHTLCMLTNGDLHHVTHLPHFYMNKFLLIDDPVAYACVEDWYSRRHARENELTRKGEKQVIDMTPYCRYLHKLSGKIYAGCEKLIIS